MMARRFGPVNGKVLWRFAMVSRDSREHSRGRFLLRLCGIYSRHYCDTMSGYAKLFSSILHSTIWLEPDHIRLVWITMLAMADRHGMVETSVPGLAVAARVTMAQCEEAIARLKQPDTHSRTKEFEGRRIEDAPGGFLVLTYEIHRGRASAASKRENQAARQARWRERKKLGLVGSETEAVDADASQPIDIEHASGSASASASGSGSGSSDLDPDPERATCCPTTLDESFAGYPEMAERLGVTEEALRIGAHEFVSHWTIGGGAGSRKTHWAKWLRKDLMRKHELGKLGSGPRLPQTTVDSWTGWTTEQSDRLLTIGRDPHREASDFQNYWKSEGKRLADWTAKAENRVQQLEDGSRERSGGGARGELTGIAKRHAEAKAGRLGELAKKLADENPNDHMEWQFRMEECEDAKRRTAGRPR